MKPFMRRLYEALAEYRKRAAVRSENISLVREHDAIMQDRRLAEEHVHASWRARRAGEPGCSLCA
jgi:hypothetical protein